jgi:hypothetical protein
MRTWHFLPITCLIVVSSAACGGDPDETGSPGSQGAGGASSSTGLPSGAGGDGGGGGAGTGGAGGAGGGSSETAVPTSGPELFAYLKAGSYLGFPAESVVHDSTGPHGGKVRTYITPSLEASLKAGNTEHPIHAAAIKELYLSGMSVQGWAVSVKTKDTSDGGNGWYWYEIYSATDPSSPVADGNGVPLCYNCHAAGKDFVLSPFPLQ